MSNERQDEFFSWRGPVSSPEALPEQGLDDRELTWQRLAERLQKKPRRRAAGYWIAAACLLLASLPASHFFLDRPALQQRAARHGAAERQTLSTGVAAERQPVSNSGVAAERQPVSNSGVAGKLMVANSPLLSRRVQVPPPAARQAGLAARQSDRLPAPGRTAPVTAPTDTLTLALAAAPDPGPGAATQPTRTQASPAQASPAQAPPRTLRIVCLNELNKTAGPGPVNPKKEAPFQLIGSAGDAGSWTTARTAVIGLTIGPPALPNH